MKITSNSQHFSVAPVTTRDSHQQPSDSSSANKPSQASIELHQSIVLSSEQKSQLAQNFQANKLSAQGHIAIAQYQSIASFEHQQQLNNMLGLDEFV